jgi:hypothetical protein
MLLAATPACPSDTEGDARVAATTGVAFAAVRRSNRRMLLVCNGAYKSGSTWLFRILQSMTGFGGVPKAYGASGWEGTGIHPPLLGRFLRRENYRDQNYIIKGHFFERAHLLMNRPGVKVANIRRDTRDVVVSAFFYERMKGFETPEDIGTYYQRRGWKVARMVVQYNRLWENRPGTYMSSYDALHNDFAAECCRLAAFVGVSIADADIERIREENKLSKLKEKYDERSADGSQSFFRKGVIGDWKQHLTDDIAADIERIEKQQTGYPSAVDMFQLRLRHAYLAVTRK